MKGALKTYLIVVADIIVGLGATCNDFHVPHSRMVAKYGFKATALWMILGNTTVRRQDRLLEEARDVMKIKIIK